MEQLEALRRKIGSARSLQSVVKTMKSLAAANIRQYERAAEALNEYNLTIEMGLQIVVRNMPEVTGAGGAPAQEKPLCAVVFGSEYGMCGQFNEQIVSFAVSRMDRLKTGKDKRIVLAVGERVISRLEDAGQKIEEQFPIFGSLADITSIMQDVLIKIEELRREQEIERVILFFNRQAAGTSFQPGMLRLLPLGRKWLQDLAKKEWRSRSLPAFTVDRDRLFSSLIRQRLFFSLYRAFTESLASENASRLSSMQAAEKNVEERLNELSTQFHRLRQESITTELLDIVSGYEALSGEVR